MVYQQYYRKLLCALLLLIFLWLCLHILSGCLPCSVLVLNLMQEHDLKLSDIQSAAAQLELLPGALDFLNRIRQNFQVVILSDTFQLFYKIPRLFKTKFMVLIFVLLPLCFLNPSTPSHTTKRTVFVDMGLHEKR